MQEFKVGRNKPFTHTSFDGGSYCIPQTHIQHFMALYKDALKSGASLSITEAHQSVSPILIDFDFKQGEHKERLYDMEKHIKPILDALGIIIRDYVENPDYVLYLLEKPSPRQDPSKAGCYKDGFHIQYPDIVTCPEIQYAIRQRFLDEHSDKLCIPGVLNNPHSIYDEAVIERNNWLMYGSKKPNEQFPWKATFGKEYTDSNINLVDRLSIRYKHECIYSTKGSQTKKSLSSTKSCISFVNSSSVTPSGATLSSTEDYTELALKLVDILSPQRAEEYDSWIKTGFCLHNINERELLQSWVEFSKHSIKFRISECEKKWRAMTDRGLTICSLRSWAKEDDIEAYNAIMQKYNASMQIDVMDNDDKQTLINNITDKDMGMSDLVYRLFKDTIKYVNTDVYYLFDEKQTIWIEYKENHLYSTIMSRVSAVLKQLSHAVSEDVPKEGDNQEEEQKRLNKLKTMINAMENRVKTSAGMGSIMKTAAVHFRSPNFHNELDCFPYLLGVKNGVVDLRTGELRDRQPQDMIFNICNVYYNPNASTALIESILTSAMAEDHEMVSFIQKLLGYSITGEVKEEIFVIMTGSGRNCKSLISQVLQLIMNRMYVEMNTGVLIENKNVANMDAEKAKIRGARLAVFNELSPGDRLRMDTVKLFSGGDTIPAAAKLKDRIEIIPRQQCILNTNYMPIIYEVDIAIIKRLICIHFPVKFTDLEPGEKPTLYKRQRDNDLKDKVKADLDGVFNWLVRGSVKWYASQDLKKSAPKKVKDFGRSYVE